MADLWLTHKPYIKRQSWPRMGLSFWPAGRMKAKPRLIVNHSTETLGFPSYNGGAAAPHFTIDLRTGETRQHIPLNWGSRCLAVSTGGVTDRTVNNSGTIQIEVIGAVTPGYPKTYGHYDLVNTFPKDERAQRYLARLWRDIADATGIPLQLSSYGYWKTYPSSYGVRASQRLSSAQFRDAMGILGHQHAPANDHGDGLYGRAVGGRAIDLEKVVALAKSGAAAPTNPAKPDATKGFDASYLKRTDETLGLLGYSGDVWAKTLAYQKDYGLDPEDGLPGPQTEKHLEATMSRLEKKIDRVAEDVWRVRIGKEGYQARSWLRGGNLKAGRAAVSADQAVKTLAAQTAALDVLAEAVAKAQSVDVKALKAEVRDAVSEAVGSLEADVTLTVKAEPEGDETDESV